MRTPSRALLVLLLGTLGACGTLRPSAAAPADERRAIDALLDGWHAAAGRADGEGYLGLLSTDAVYLGTDAGERWSAEAFRSFCEPYFARGVGWTYEPRARHVVVEQSLAWFDELLWNDKYGECRGTGVLRKQSGEWRLAHYSLTLLVPNEVAGEVVELIRAR